MLQCLYPLQQIIFHHVFGPLMDDKNLVIESQLVKALFVLQILDNVCVRVCVCVCLWANQLFQVIRLGIMVDQGLPCVYHYISRSSGKLL